MLNNSTSVPVSTRRYLLILLAIFVATILVCLVSLSMGSSQIPFSDIINILFADSGTDISSRIIREIRLPRVIAGFCVGGMLALAGCLMQVLLRNPLAEPYVLGVSGGAAVFALAAMISGFTGVLVNSAAFAGAVISIFLVFSLSRTGGEWSSMRTLLTGVVLAAGWGAIISFLLAVSPADRLHGMLFWLMGDLGFARNSFWNGLILLAALVTCLVIARALNLLANGELNAMALGVPVNNLTYGIYFLASFLTATAVMEAGSIGFVGLLVPHITRLLTGSDHRILLPVSVMLGGGLLVLADALARTVMAPQQLPVGVLTAMIGVPVFLLIMQSVLLKKT